jgi:aminoacylase
MEPPPTESPPPPHLPLLTAEQEQAAVDAFCEFLRFETVSSVAAASGAYRAAADWLQQQLTLADCFDRVFTLPEASAASPVVVALWKGRDEQLPCLVLNSHYDVVPASDHDWTVPPFAGLCQNDRIYGRGAQDMKCVCVQYIYACKYLRELDSRWRPERNIYLLFVPDEEVGGSGMAVFLDSHLYKTLPNGIALALDEGLASTTDEFAVFYGERLPWWVNVTATGPTGHASRFIDRTAVEQIVQVANKALAFRQDQRALLGLTPDSACAHAVAAAQTALGDVTSLNITTLQAGVRVGDTFAYNCVPPTATCSLDIRISPHMRPSDMAALLDQWCRECSAPDHPTRAAAITTVRWSDVHACSHHPADVSSSLPQQHATTSTNVTENLWYGVFSTALTTRMGLPLALPQIFPAATDSRFLRALGIRALGFSPMRNTEIRLHETDEYVPVQTFLEGIAIYVGLIHALGSQGAVLEEQEALAAATAGTTTE